MAIERKVRSVGTKSITYPWLRRYIVIGPYNRRFRQDLTASVLARMFSSAAKSASKRRQRKVDPGHR